MRNPARLLVISLALLVPFGFTPASGAPTGAAAQPQSQAQAAASAPEAIWLVLINNVSATTANLRGVGTDVTAMVTIPMKSLAGCQEEGARWKAAETGFRKGFREYHCVEAR